MTSSSELSLGILGCSYIAPISVIGPARKIAGIRAMGIAARDPLRARSYAATHGIPVAYSSYDQLLESDVQCVYIALPPIAQAQWTRHALMAGKHVLVEKPLALDEEEARAIANLAKGSSLQVLEAVMVQHHPWQAALSDIIQTGRYGRVRRLHTRICSEFGDLAPTNFRRFPEVGGGVFFDEAPYWLQFVQRMLGLECIALKGRSSFAGPRGLDWTFDASLSYADGVEVTAFCSYEHAREASHVIEFEHATLEIKNFFRPVFGSYKFRININKNDGTTSTIIFEAQNYYENQLRFFRDVVRGTQANVSLEASIQRIALTRAIVIDARGHARLQPDG